MKPDVLWLRGSLNRWLQRLEPERSFGRNFKLSHYPDPTTDALADRLTVQYCDHCNCSRCTEVSELRSLLTAFERDRNARVWACSCGWLYAVTKSDMRKYGVPSECNRCCRERLYEREPPTIENIHSRIKLLTESRS